MHDWHQVILERLQPLRLSAAAESDLAEELAPHLEDHYRELTSGGASDEEAYRKCVAELDDAYRLRTAKYEVMPARDIKPGNLIDDLGRDLRYAVRTMRKSPLFVLFVVVTLALGIGANTTVFTLINTLILTPLPAPDSARLASMGVVKTGSTPKSSAPLPVSHADLKDYRARNGVFASLAGYTPPRAITWQSDQSSQRMFAEVVTGNYFSTLGLAPAAGRFFLPEEDSTPGAHPVAVMNYGTWQAQFGGTSDVVGRTLRINHVELAVIGVAPRNFIGMNAIFGPDLWIPAAMMERVMPNEMQNALSDRAKPVFQGVGRLRPGFTRAQAQANMATIAADLAREYPLTDEGHTAMVVPIRDVLLTTAGGGAAAGPIRFGSAVLLIVVGIVLLIACSNVANLLLARAAARQQEMAVRLAMGASPRRLVRQLLTESILMGLLSGAVGLYIGYMGLQVLFGQLPSAANFVLPRFDTKVFLYALSISLATGFLFGIMPALRASHASLAETLKQEARTAGRSRSRVTVANALLAGQVAFSFLLLVMATMFLRSIQRAYEIDPGFQTAHLAVFMTNPGQAGFEKFQTKAFYRAAGERVAAIPGVESASWASNMPLWSRAVTALEVEGHQQRSQADKTTTVVNTVAPRYFETAGVAIGNGREFGDADQESSMPVAIVNEKLARDYWPDGSALGRRIRLAGEKEMRLIVGIARNANYSSWGEPAQLCAYVPLEQKYSDGMNLYVRSKGDPRQILRSVEREVRATAPQVLVNYARTGREIIDSGLFQAKLGVALLSVFGLLALGLASVGLYGIMAYSVNQRKREIGLRMALGAAESSVLRLVLKQGMTLVLAGVILGFGAALVAGRLLSRMLYGVSATDPLSVIAAALVLSAVALAACYLPARRASRVDPVVALREG